jgi:type IV secretion system protein VirB10
MAEPTDNEENGLEEERKIPPVGKQDSGNKDKYFVPGMIAFMVVAALVVWGYHTSTQEVQETLTDQNDEKFDREVVTRFEIPERIPEPTEVPVTAIEPAEVTIQAPVKPQLSPEELRQQQAEADLRERRKRSPVVVYDQMGTKSTESASYGASAAEKKKEKLLSALGEQLKATKSSLGGLGGDSEQSKDKLNDRLMASETPGVQATLIRQEEQPYIIAQGKMIGAILETAISSDLPGMVRAVVSENVYSLDGDILLLEKGSRLVGEYQSGVRQGQVRVFVTWNRVITPNGVDVKLESPGTGPLGRTGLAGWVDNHFLERFGSSILLSVIGGVTANIASDGSPASAQVREDVSDSFNRSAEIALENSINMPPTINKNQGEYIKVFVARDLNFKSAYQLNLRQKGVVANVSSSR